MFAAYYPSCRGLFGLYDPTPIDENAALTYEVLGWYSRHDEDILAQLPSLERLKAYYHWVLPEGSVVPSCLVCYARFTFKAPTDSPPTPLRVAIGSNAMNALAALAAADAGAAEKQNIEISVAALTHAAAIAPLEVDQDSALKAATHEAGFVAEFGGVLWSLRPEGQGAAEAHADPEALREAPIPPTLASHLNRLNAEQGAFDASFRQLHSAREQLLADWSKLMMLLYPQSDQSASPLDPSLAHDFIQNRRGLATIKAQQEALGNLDLPVEQGGLQVDPTGALPSPINDQGALNIPATVSPTLAGRVAAVAQKSLRKLAVYNATALSGRRDGVPSLNARDGYLRFDGVSGLTLDQIEGWGSGPSLGDGNYLSAFTMWIRLRPEGAGAVLTFGPHVALSLDLDLKAVLKVGSEDSTGLATNTPLAKDQWTNLVATYDSLTGTRALYLETGMDSSDQMAGRPFPGLSGERQLPVLAPPSAETAFPRFVGAVARVLILPGRAAAFDQVADLLKRPLPPALRLARQSAPRFWRPRDPVIALEGPAARASGRHSRDNLNAHIVSVNDVDPFGPQSPRNQQAKALDDLSESLDAILKADPNDAGISESDGAPWHPIAIEWETDFHPIAATAAGVSSDYLVDNFELEMDGPDLVPKSTVIPVLIDRAAVTSGRSVLTPFANRLLQDRVKEWDKKYRLDKDLLAEQAVVDRPEVQSQTLTGFHEALLQRAQLFNLPADDPLALSGGALSDPMTGRAFSNETVRAALSEARAGPTATGALAMSAAQPNQPFVPVRAGRLTLRRLRLIDAFGQVLNVPVQDVVRPAALSRGAGVPTNAFQLPPRLSQPARLTFRWLSADNSLEESNDHPESSPLCGWMAANYIEDGLAVYEAGGAALGEIAKGSSTGWLAAPGGRRVPPERFDNIALTRTVQALISRDQSEIEAILSAIRESLGRILPSLDGVDPGLSLIAARPLALVRARLRLELKGPAAIDQSWVAFARDLRAIGSHDGRISDLLCPVRLGERQRLDDGLVGFWREDASGLPVGPFHAPALLRSGDNPGKGVVCSDDANFAMMLRPNGPPETLTMLIDPFARVHATCGLLPVKAISLPSEYFTRSLSLIETWMLASPILTPAGKLALPLPATKGASWAWRGRTPEGWETLPPSSLASPRSDAAFEGPTEAREGWLILTREIER